MKKLLLLCTTLPIIFVANIVEAQSPPWLEVGSEWTYQHGHCCGPEHFQVKFGISEETTYLGKACAKMDHLSGWGYGCMSLQPPFYFYVSNDSLFFSSNVLDEFRFAFDFGAEPGDSWEFLTGAGESTEAFSVEVNSLTTINIDGHTLRQLNVTFEYLDDPVYSIIYPQTMNITEVIGASDMFFVPMGHGSICDYENNVTFQCFESPSLSYLNPIYPACDFITSVEALEEKQEMHIFPNPANSWVRIDGQGAAQVHRVEVYNLSGQIVHSHTLQQTGNGFIDVSALPPGMYVVHAHQSDRVVTAKFVKE